MFADISKESGSSSFLQIQTEKNFYIIAVFDLIRQFVPKKYYSISKKFQFAEST